MVPFLLVRKQENRKPNQQGQLQTSQTEPTLFIIESCANMISFGWFGSICRFFQFAYIPIGLDIDLLNIFEMFEDLPIRIMLMIVNSFFVSYMGPMVHVMELFAFL